VSFGLDPDLPVIMRATLLRPLRVALATSAPLALTLLVPAAAAAHGIWGHVHVTGWAIENLPEGELKELLSDPEVMNAALFGAAYTDSGYWPRGSVASQTRAYTEHTHWEPFIEDFVEWIRVNDPPPWDNLESKKRFAFMLGCASHGLQDEIFDSIFIDQVDYHDRGGQDVADPGTDGFLSLDGHLRFMPTEYFPKETVIELYEVLNLGIDEETIRYGLDAMEALYVNPRSGYAVAASLGRQHEAKLPWTRTAYFDPDVPGSIRSEILPTMLYQMALWERVNGISQAESPILFQYPDTGRRIRSLDPADPASWVTIVTGAGTRARDVSASWSLPDGREVPHTLHGTHWGGLDDWSRVIQIRPTSALPADAATQVEWSFGGSLINEAPTTARIRIEARTVCAEGSGACELDCDARTGLVSASEVDLPLGRPDRCVAPVAGGSGDGSGDAPGSGAGGDAAGGSAGGGCMVAAPSAPTLWLAGMLIWLFRRRRA
jgi:hypothetical protein